jgi:hypothetical protein
MAPESKYELVHLDGTPVVQDERQLVLVHLDDREQRVKRTDPVPVKKGYGAVSSVEALRSQRFDRNGSNHPTIAPNTKKETQE